MIPNSILIPYLGLIKQGRPTHAQLVFPSYSVTLDDSNIAHEGGITIADILNADEDITFGKAVSRQAIITLLNSNQIGQYLWTDTFYINIGVEDPNGVTRWQKIGYFKAKKPEKLKRTETIQLVAYDRMPEFDVLADDFLASLTYPTTLEDIYHDLCTYIGINYSAGDEMAFMMSQSYDASPFPAGITCRQILGWIAEANGCYAKIEYDGTVKLFWFSDQTSTYAVNGDDYYRIDIGEYPVLQPDSVRISYSDNSGTSSIYPLNGSNPYGVVDNPFLAEANATTRQLYSTEVLNRLNAIGTYNTCNIDIFGNWLVQTGDIISVTYDNTTLSVPIFSRSFSWNGGCDDSYECTGNATRAEMSGSVMEQYMEGQKIANKYTIQSGIDITDQGVTISGQKFLKLISGGVLDVQSSNFTLDSAGGILATGFWTLDSTGLHCVCDPTVPGIVDKQFHINTITANGSGVFSLSTGDSVNDHARVFLNDLQEGGLPFIDLYPDLVTGNNLGYLGKTTPWKKIFADDIDVTNLNVNGNPYIEPSVMTGATASADGIAGYVPKPLTGYQNRVLNGGGNWVAGVNWSGNLTANDDLDNYTAPGMYRCSAANAATASNTPTTNSFTLIVIYGYASTAGYQFVYPSGDAASYYVRRRYSSSWKPWDKYEASTSSTFVHTTGNEDIEGTKTFNDTTIRLGTSSRYKYINLLKGSSVCGQIMFDNGNTTNQTTNRFYFRQYSPKTTADATNTGHYESFTFPDPAKDLDSDPSAYTILTSKNKVTIAQGGTGMGATETTSTKADVFGTTATSSLSSVSASIWGKVVSLHIVTKSSGSAGFASLGTLVSKYRPAQAYGTDALPNYIKITTGGAVTAYHQASGTSDFVIDVTYLTA